MKQQRTTLRINYWRFVSQWVLTALLAALFAPATYVAVIIAMMFVLGMLDMILFNQIPEIIEAIFIILVAVVGGAITLGAVIGGLQRNVVRRQLHRDLENWRTNSILGALLGLTILALMFISVSPLMSPNNMLLPFAITMPIFITCMASIQFLSLRRSMHDAWLWILANLVGGIVFAQFTFGHLFMSDYETFDFIGMIVGIVLQSFLMAHTLAYLVERRTVVLVHAPATRHKAVEVPEPVDYERPHSIWDEAI